MSATSDAMRREWKENDARRDAGLTTPEDIERADNLQYGPDPKWNLLDVYRPKSGHGKKLPVIVNVHGGGWVYGDKDLYQFYGMTLAQRGFAVVNFTYRLAPEVKFPAALEDTNAVIAWMYEHQQEYLLDMDHVFLVGDSAGGHLAGLYTSICTNPEYAAQYKFQVPNCFVPNAVAFNCAAFVLVGQEVLGALQDSDIQKDMLPEDEKEAERIKALLNVPEFVTDAFPPVFLMTCEGDFCKPQAPLMEEVLKKHHIPYIYKIYGEEEKPLYHVFHVTIQEPMGQFCNDEECAFFKTIMEG